MNLEERKKAVYSYWNKTELGKKMISSNNFSDSDLLFLIPNNKKRKLGLPLTRIGKRRNKHKYKRNKKRNLMSFRLFDVIEEILEERLSSLDFQNGFFGKFVEAKNLDLGDRVSTYYETIE